MMGNKMVPVGMGRNLTFVCLKCGYKEDIDIEVGGFGTCPKCDPVELPYQDTMHIIDASVARTDVPFVVKGDKLVLSEKYRRVE